MTKPPSASYRQRALRGCAPELQDRPAEDRAVLELQQPLEEHLRAPDRFGRVCFPWGAGDHCRGITSDLEVVERQTTAGCIALRHGRGTSPEAHPVWPQRRREHELPRPNFRAHTKPSSSRSTTCAAVIPALPSLRSSLLL